MELLSDAIGCLRNIQPDASPLVPRPTIPNPAAVYLAGLAPRSRIVQRQALDSIARFASSGIHRSDGLNWPSLTYADTAAIRAQLAGAYAPATANRMLAAMKGTLRECRRLGLMSAEACERACDLKNVRGETLLRGRALSPEELKALFGSCASDSSLLGRRDAAMLALLYGSGLRRAEAATLLVADYEVDTGQVTVRRGKGRKDRITYARGGAAAAIAAWIAARGDWEGPLLCPVHWRGTVIRRCVSAQGIYVALKQRGKRAGVASFSPHDCRRSYATHLLDADVDLGTVQDLMGHSSIQTTRRYDRRGEKRKVTATDRLEVPF